MSRSKTKPYRLFSVMTLLLTSVFLNIAGCSSSPIDKQSCKAWAEITTGEYLLTNNVWGAQDYKDIKQCIATKDKGYEWNWQWQGHDGNVLAYPSILYGHKPWNKHSTSPRLPVKVDDVKKLTVTFKAKQVGSGSHNLLLESWITSSAVPKPSTRTVELAIHLLQQNWPGMPGKKVDTVFIDNHQFDVYVEPSIDVPGDEYHWLYLGFVYTGVKKNQLPSNSNAYSELERIDMSAFISYSTKHNYIDTQHYLASIELGSELVSGEGKTRVETFAVEF